MTNDNGEGQSKRRPAALTLIMTEQIRDIGEQIEALAAENGLTKTQVMAVALRYGLLAIEKDNLLLLTPPDRWLWAERKSRQRRAK